MRFLFTLLVCGIALIFLTSCDDKMALAESSFGQLGRTDSKASPVSVISMGRDDEEGKAKKWHIGGGEDLPVDHAIEAFGCPF